MFSFADMHATLFAGPLAEPIKIAGRDARAFVHRNAAIIGEQGEVLARKTVIELPQSDPAARGQSVVIGGRNYVIDKQATDDLQASDDGYVVRWVLRDA